MKRSHLKSKPLPREHITSAWIRHNIREGLSHIPFSTCRKLWKLPIKHIKPQPIFTPEQEIYLSLITNSDGYRQALRLRHTNFRQWNLSPH